MVIDLKNTDVCCPFWTKKKSQAGFRVRSKIPKIHWVTANPNEKGIKNVVFLTAS